MLVERLSQVERPLSQVERLSLVERFNSQSVLTEGIAIAYEGFTASVPMPEGIALVIMGLTSSVPIEGIALSIRFFASVILEANAFDNVVVVPIIATRDRIPKIKI